RLLGTPSRHALSASPGLHPQQVPMEQAPTIGHLPSLAMPPPRSLAAHALRREESGNAVLPLSSDPTDNSNASVFGSPARVPSSSPGIVGDSPARSILGSLPQFYVPLPPNSELSPLLGATPTKQRYQNQATLPADMELDSGQDNSAP